ncbi:MAG: DUF1153 domain-containing protein [Candidatus Paceibacterota bacterium]
MVIYIGSFKEAFMNMGIPKPPANSEEQVSTITIDDLPPSETRWVSRRKLEVVTAVLSGQVQLEDVLEKYNMTEREFRLWELGFLSAGKKGLMVTKFQWWRRNNGSEL